MRNVSGLDLKTATELLLRIVFGSEFQTAGAEHYKDSAVAHPESATASKTIVRCCKQSQRHQNIIERMTTEKATNTERPSNMQHVKQ